MIHVRAKIALFWLSQEILKQIRSKSDTGDKYRTSKDVSYFTMIDLMTRESYIQEKDVRNLQWIHEVDLYQKESSV